MPALGSGAKVAEALFPERIDGVLHFAPRQLYVSHLPQIGVGRVTSDPVISRANEWARRYDHVWQVGRCLDRLAVHNEILAVLDCLGDVTIGAESAAVGVERNRVVYLF